MQQYEIIVNTENDNVWNSDILYHHEDDDECNDEEEDEEPILEREDSIWDSETCFLNTTSNLQEVPFDDIPAAPVIKLAMKYDNVYFDLEEAVPIFAKTKYYNPFKKKRMNYSKWKQLEPILENELKKAKNQYLRLMHKKPRK